MFDKARFNTEVRKWINTGQEIRRYMYNVSSDPVFFDIGAFKGDWSRQMISRYGGKSYMFEVLPQYLDILKRDFKDSNYVLCEFGLSGKTQCIETGLENTTDSFSVFENTSTNKVNISLKRMSDFIEEGSITAIDVCKINIEGGEYELLEHMIDADICKLCKNIQVQFHGQYPIDNFYNRWVDIRKSLTETHNLTYDYYFTWENWQFKL